MKSCARLPCLLLFLLARLSVQQSSVTPNFVHPPAHPGNFDYAQDEVWLVGSQIPIKWVSGLPQYYIWLWQQLPDAGAASVGQAIYTKSISDNETGGFVWTVNTQNFDNTKSPIYFLYMGPNNTLTGGAISRYFNITTDVTSVRLSSTSTLPAATSTSTQTSSAQATFTTTTLVRTTSGANGLTTITSIGTALASAGPSSTSTSGASPTSSAQSQKDGSSSNTGTKVGLGVGLGVGIPLILILTAILVVLMRKRNRSHSTPGYTPAPPFSPSDSKDAKMSEYRPTHEYQQELGGREMQSELSAGDNQRFPVELAGTTPSRRRF